MGLVALLALPRRYAFLEQSLREPAPGRISTGLKGHQRHQVHLLGEYVGLGTRVADEALGVELLGDLHHLLGGETKLAGALLLHFLGSNAGSCSLDMHLNCYNSVASIIGRRMKFTIVSSGSGLHLLLGLLVTFSTVAVGFSWQMSRKTSQGSFSNSLLRAHLC